MFSSTVIVAVQVEVFPLASVTVNSTWFVPVPEQSNVLGVMETSTMAQLSVEPLFTSAASTTAFPLASNATVTSWQRAVGGVLSSTVTSAVQVETFPFASVTVNVTVVTPVFEQSNEVGVTERLLMLQLSVLLLSKSAAIIAASPLASNCTVIS